MDANGSRFHALVTQGDWTLHAQPDAHWAWLPDDAAHPQALGQLVLRPLLFEFKASSAAALPEPGSRAGGVFDAYGNLYALNAAGTAVRVWSSGSGTITDFWPLPEAPAAEPAPGGFGPCVPAAAPAPVVMDALTVTTGHYLVVASVAEAGLLIFDLHGGGPPLRQPWPGMPVPEALLALDDGGVALFAAGRLHRLGADLRPCLPRVASPSAFGPEPEPAPVPAPPAALPARTWRRDHRGGGVARRALDQITTTLSLVNPLQPQQRETLAELPGGGWFDAEVSPDEKTLAIVRYESAAVSEVWLIDLASGQRRRALPAPEQTIQAAHYVGGWSADGRALLFTSDRASEFAELMRLDLATGAVTRLSADTPWDVSGTSVNRQAAPQGSQALTAITANVDGRDELRLIDARTGAPYTLASGAVLPALPAGSVSRAEFHPARNELAFVVNSAQGPSQVHSLDMSNPATPRITHWTQAVGTEGMNLAAIPAQEIVRWKSFDGRTISGVLSLPPAHFQGRRPVVMAVHGGPEGQAKQGWQGRINYLVQQMGLAVLEPNVRGSSGYGKTFLSLDNGRLREDSVKDMGTAIDWMATHPRLDASRVVVTGGSYGGYMALAASTRLASRISGAMSAVGISNFVSFLENTESYRRDLRRVEYGDERDPAMRAFLHSISPLTHVDRISKPLMVVQGKNDPRVPWTESEQIVRSLQARGTPVWYLLADNEGHGFARRENADYYFVALTEFLQRTLKP